MAIYIRPRKWPRIIKPVRCDADAPAYPTYGPCYLYTLGDKDEALTRIRYVGISCDPIRRYTAHVNTRHYYGEKGDWLRDVYRRNALIMEIQEVYPTRLDALRAERRMIRHLRHQLVNAI